MEIPLALLNLFLGLFKVDGLGIGLVGHPLLASVQDAHQVIPEEEEVVEDVPMTLESYLDEVPEDFSDIEDIDEELIVDEELDLDLDDNFDIDSLDVDALTNDAFHRELIEQTQTLQHRIVDQEKHIEDMSDTIVRTNRMLNAVLAILLLAIFVVIVLIAVQFSKII